MRPWLLTALLLATTLAGCFDDLPEGPAPDTAPDDTMQPTHGLGAGNATLYLHSDGSDHWMDTDEDATATALTASGTAANPAPRIRFALRPAPERDVVLGGPIHVDLTVDVDPLVGESPRYEASLSIDGKPAAFASGTDPRLDLDSPDWPVGADVVLELCVCPQTTTVAYGFALHTDGTSTVTLAFDDPAAAPASPASNTTGSTSQGSAGKGAVTVTKENGAWVARRTDTYQEPVSVSKAHVGLAVPVGDISIRHEGTGSKLVIDLGARGDTEEEARNNLSAMKTLYDAGTRSGFFDLEASVRTPDQQWSNQWAHMTLTLSPSDLATLTVDTSTGDVTVGPFTGDTWDLDTSTGDIDLRGFTLHDLTIQTSTGEVTLQGTVDALEVDTSTGDVDANVQAAASGTWNIDTSTGKIQVRAPEDATRGYDATADTTTGEITFTFSDASDVGTQDDEHKHVRTDGYDGRSIKTVLTLDTSTADIRAGSS